MSQRKSQIPNSSLPPSQRSDTFFQIPEITAGNFEDELEAAVTLEDHELVLEILDKAPNFYKKKVEYSLLRATSLMSLGQSDQALDLLLKLEKTQQNYLPLYLPLAFICMENDWPGSALRAALRVRKSRAIDPETQELVENIISEATSMITAEAKNESLPFEKMQRATIQNEKAQIAFAKHRFSEVIHFTKEAIKIAPNWTPPQNNLAQALFFSGKVNEAIQITENVLAQDPDNLFALEKMVIYLFGAGNINRASEYAARFAAFSDDFEVDSDEMKRLISILALVEDTSSLWKLAQRFADEDATSLSVRTWHILAVSAARTGEMSVAIKLMEKIDKEIIRKSEILFLDDLRRVNAQPKSSLKWLPPFYPNLEIYLIPPIIAELEAIFDNAPEEMTAVAQKKLDNLFIKYPFLMPVIKLAILNSETNDFACTILVNLLSFNEDEELYRFAFSQTGSLSARMNVLKILFQHDRYTGPNLVRLWDESIQDWCEVKLVFQKIVKSFIKAQPETMKLMEKANLATSPDVAKNYYLKAIEMEASYPVAYFNLAILFFKEGKMKEGNDMLEKSIIADPNFMYGHASIAMNAANSDDAVKAMHHLRIVDAAKQITPETAVVANLAYFHLAIDDQDIHTARERFVMAETIDPQSKLVQHNRIILQEAEAYEKKHGERFKRDQKNMLATYKKLMETPLTATTNLNTCLETYPKKLLIACADFLRTSRVGSKGELAAWLTGNLLNAKFLKETLRDDLNKDDRAALRWILENGGTRPWKELTDKYGDDIHDMSLWGIQIPNGTIARLRLAGILFTGILDAEQVGFIPANIRPLLSRTLKGLVEKNTNSTDK